MKTQFAVAATALLALTSCNPDRIDPIGPIAAKECKETVRSLVNARIAASGEFITVRSGLWSDASTWKHGVVPTSGSSGKIIIEHTVGFDSAVLGEDYIFNGGMNVNHGGGLNFDGSKTVTINGDVNISTFVETEGLFTVRGGNFNINGNARLVATDGVVLDGAHGGINGRLQTARDWKVINNSTIHVNASAGIYVGDDLHVGRASDPSDRSMINNDLVGTCDLANFIVKDVILMNTTQARIQGNGTIIIGATSNGDDNQASYNEIYARVYGVNGTNYASQVTSSKPAATILAQYDANYPKVPYCSDPLPVKIEYFTASAVSGNQVEFKWKTSEESNSGSFTILSVKPCESMSQARAVVAKAANGSAQSYSEKIVVTEGGVHYFKLIQTDLDGTQQELSGWVSVKIGK